MKEIEELKQEIKVLNEVIDDKDFLIKSLEEKNYDLEFDLGLKQK